MTETPIDDAALLRILAFAAVENCADESGIDHADLLALARDRLSSTRQPSVITHLDQCPYCCMLLEEYRVDTPSLGTMRYAVVVAVAAAVVAFVDHFEPPAPPTYVVSDVQGLMATMMDEPSNLGSVWHVSTGAKIRLALRPTIVASLGPDATVGVFVETSKRTFRRAVAAVSPRRVDGATTFRVEIEGRELFVGRGGSDRIAIVVARSNAALSALEGVQSFCAGREGVVDVTYRRVATQVGEVDPIR